MAKVKDRASKVKQLLADETYQLVMESVKNQQIAVFVDTGSSTEARESAHQIIRALGRIENYINSVLTDEKIFDKNNL